MLKLVVTSIDRIKTILKPTLLILLMMQASFASTYTLDNILESLAQNNTLAKSLEKEGLALEAKNRANTASEPLEVFADGTRAEPIIGKSGNEYGVGVAKKFTIASIQEEEQKITRLTNQAYLLEEEKNILNFRNTIKNIYHQHCLDRQKYRSFNKSYQEFEKLYKKKQKAFKHQEISKIELMQLEIEKNRLHTQLQEIKMKKDVSKKDLFILSNTAYTRGTKLSCEDMYPIRSNIRIDNSFQLSNQAHEKRLQSTQQALKRYSSYVDSIDVSAQYTDELDVDKYTVGLSIPLNFTSSRNEQERAAAMYENSSISLKYEQTMREKKSLFIQLKSHLKNSALTLESLKSNYQNYQKNLVPLIRKSYELGETSVIEYLLNRQRSYQLRQEIYNTKKTYYTLLFKLYTLSENKDQK